MSPSSGRPSGIFPITRRPSHLPESTARGGTRQLVEPYRHGPGALPEMRRRSGVPDTLELDLSTCCAWPVRAPADNVSLSEHGTCRLAKEVLPSSSQRAKRPKDNGKNVVPHPGPGPDRESSRFGGHRGDHHCTNTSEPSRTDRCGALREKAVGRASHDRVSDSSLRQARGRHAVPGQGRLLTALERLSSHVVCYGCTYFASATSGPFAGSGGPTGSLRRTSSRALSSSATGTHASSTPRARQLPV